MESIAADWWSVIGWWLDHLTLPFDDAERWPRSEPTLQLYVRGGRLRPIPLRATNGRERADAWEGEEGMASPPEHTTLDPTPDADRPQQEANQQVGTDVSADLDALFEREGLMRHLAVGDVDGAVEVRACGPVVMLGPGDADAVAAPDPVRTGFPGKPASAMSLEEYNAFLFVWLERAVERGLVRCSQCGKVLLAGDDLPDAETWDAILIEKELVAWMAVHFDCKKKIAKKLKGMNPFELKVAPPPEIDLSDAVIPEQHSVDEMYDLGDLGELDSPLDARENAQDEEEPDHGAK